MEGLDALNKLKKESYCNCSLSDDNEYFCMGGLLKDTDEIKTIESELKVAKILKEKIGYNIKPMYLEEVGKYVIRIELGYTHQDFEITEEQYTAIVEWLKGE